MVLMRFASFKRQETAKNAPKCHKNANTFSMVNARLNISQNGYKLDAENAPAPKDSPELCQILHIIFVEDTVNVEYVKRIIENYKSNPKKWRKYAKYDPHK
jgi:hypothetical protein